MNLTEKRILVTGGSGFLGSYVCEELQRRGMSAGLGISTFQATTRGYDLTIEADVTRMFNKVQPNVVIHCAAYCGGIGLNQAEPIKMLNQNIAMNANIVQACLGFGVEKLVAIGSVCAYPKETPVPFKESYIWDGYPEATNAPYGIAKRVLLTQCQIYREKYGLNAVYLLPANLYGPRDDFDLATAHVIPALIHRIIDARQAGDKSVTIWGDGTPTRDFLYVEDAAQAVVDAAEKYDGCEPLNIGTGEETSISNLTAQICALTGYHGFLNLDKKKPNGQLRRALDSALAKKAIGYEPKTKLADGLAKTIKWYEETNHIVRPVEVKAARVELKPVEVPPPSVSTDSIAPTEPVPVVITETIVPGDSP